MRVPKKIVIIQDYLRNGGTERQSLHLARAFAEAGQEVTLLTFRPGGELASLANSSTSLRVARQSQLPNPKKIPNPKSQIPLRVREWPDNPAFLTLQPFDTHLDFFAPRLHAAIRRIAPDIVLCMGRMANCKAGGLARAFPRAAVISTMRTGKKLPAAYVRSLHATRHTIANSHEAARILRERHAVPAEKITVIHNALVCDVARASSPCSESSTGFQPVSENTPEHGLEAHATQNHGQDARATLRLLCVAMFRPEKNHRELLEIFSKLPRTQDSGLRTPDAELHLIGDGSELAPCRAFAARLNIADRVHFHGYIADPAPFYACPNNASTASTANTIAVLTSRSESLPNFLVEAHTHGIPSVAYAVGGVAECGGIAIPDGEQRQRAFLAALERLIADAPHRAAESARVAAHAREHFSPETQLARYLALFDELASQTGILSLFGAAQNAVPRDVAEKTKARETLGKK